MKLLRIILLLSMVVYFSGFSANHHPFASSGRISVTREMQTGEEIVYLVKYAFIKLGELKLVILEKKQKEKETYYRTKVYIDSYSGIPFVDIHQIFESNFSTGQYSLFFRATEKEKNYIKFTDYTFDYAKNKVYVKKGKYNPYQIWADSSAKINAKFQDGLSIFYFARMNTGQKKYVKVPCFVTEKFESMSINFYNTIENISIDAVDYDIPCVKLDGNTTFRGVYGLTGEFEGWFTNDKYAVPTIAKMHVYIGSVSVELKRWKKQGWKPPQAN